MPSTRHQLIQILSSAYANAHDISEQNLSERLGISKLDLQNYIKELQDEGYRIQWEQSKGYYIDEAPGTINENIEQWGLKTKWLGNAIIHKTSVSSTQPVAHCLAKEGATSGTIVVADEQTAGRGRLNRQWQSTKDKGIWMSMILRPDILPHLAPQLTLLTASAIAKTLKTKTSVTPQIKWPNDILVNGKKLVGILTELQTKQNAIQYVIIGVGINVNHNKSDLNTHLTRQATSLYQATGCTWDIAYLIRQILPELEALYTSFLHEGFAAIKDQWERYAYKMNDWINIRTDRQVDEGIIRGIADNGALKVDIGNRIHHFYSGEIEL